MIGVQDTERATKKLLALATASVIALGFALGQPAAAAPLAQSYVGKTCSGRYYGRDQYAGYVYPYVFELRRGQDGGLTALYGATAGKMAANPPHPVTLNAGGNFVFQTSEHVSFEGAPVDPTRIHMYRLWDGNRVAGIDSMASCH